MRDTGVITKGLSGDTETAAAQISAARTQLGILKNQMAANGLKVGARAVRLVDGTTMHVSVAGGISRVNIYTVPATSSEENPIELVVPEVPEPELPLRPARYIIQAVRGLLGGSATGLYPFTLNGITINAPAHPGQVLAIGPHVKYGFLANNSGNLFMVAIVDADSGIVVAQSKITARSPRGEFPFFPPELIAPTVITPDGVKSLGGKSEPGDLTFLGLNPAWDDVEIKLSGTGPDGSPASNSFVLAGGAMMLAAVGGLSGQIVIINGTSTTAGVVTPCPSNAINVQIPVTGVTSYPVIMTTEIGYSPAKAVSGSYLAGGNYDLAWTQTGGNIALGAALTQSEIIFTGTAGGTGTHTASGTLTVGDGYGATKDIPIDVTVTIT